MKNNRLRRDKDTIELLRQDGMLITAVPVNIEQLIFDIETKKRDYLNHYGASARFVKVPRGFVAAIREATAGIITLVDGAPLPKMYGLYMCETVSILSLDDIEVF